jgi:hypothetical protein
MIKQFTILFSSYAEKIKTKNNDLKIQQALDYRLGLFYVRFNYIFVNNMLRSSTERHNGSIDPAS